MSARDRLASEVTTRLAAAGVPTPEVDARLLLDHVEERFGSLERCDRAVLDGLVSRRASRVPLQVVLGRTTFRWVDLEVRQGVFVPRPETEVLAGVAVDALAGSDRARVVEPCTGSGAVTCALLAEVDGVEVVATDVDPGAVDLAGRNVAATLAGEASPPAWRPRRGATAEVRHGHLLDPVDPAWRGTVDVLVSNPPYLPESDRGALPDEVDHDPDAALYGGPDGHEVVDELLRLAGEWLRPGGVVALEVDERRGDDAVAAAVAAGLVGAAVLPDLTGRDRVLVARRPAGPGGVAVTGTLGDDGDGPGAS